jgi:lipopolysaccharide transport system ATP-binding protein
VAAFLDPEILVVDEVLAVGDAEFQKKAIGKMQDVSKGEGKTVLFVSHNLNSVSRLCKSGLLMENGRIKFMSDNVDKVITEYLDNGRSTDHREILINKQYISDVQIENKSIQAKFTIEINLTALVEINDIRFGIYFMDESENVLFSYITADIREKIEIKPYIENNISIKFNLDMLAGRNIKYRIWAKSSFLGKLFNSKDVLNFSHISDFEYPNDGGFLRLKPEITIS